MGVARLGRGIWMFEWACKNSEFWAHHTVDDINPASPLHTYTYVYVHIFTYTWYASRIPRLFVYEVCIRPSRISTINRKMNFLKLNRGPCSQGPSDLGVPAQTHTSAGGPRYAGPKRQEKCTRILIWYKLHDI